MKSLRLGAGASLALLFLINMANYIDRYLVIALAKPIKEEFDLTYQQVGWLTSAFVIVYMAASPVCGWLSDRVQRRFVISGAVALWSVATAFASRAWSYPILLGTRGAVGIGESGYNAAGQALLTDNFPLERRNRVMAVFSLAIPVGAATGFVLAGVLGSRFGWRGACLIAGAPGVLLAFASLALPSAKTAPKAAHPQGGFGELLSQYLRFLRDPVYTWNAIGYAMQSFALGGLAAMAPMFLEVSHRFSRDDADFASGGLVAGAGLLGTALGALIADSFASKGLLRAYSLVTGAGYLLAAPLLAAGLWIGRIDSLGPRLGSMPALACIFVAMVGAFLGTGPSNAIIAARAPASHRASAFALVVVMLHLLGDAPAPPLLGKLSDLAQHDGMGEGAALKLALLLTPVALLLGAAAMLVCAISSRRAPAIVEDA